MENSAAALRYRNCEAAVLSFYLRPFQVLCKLKKLI